jgi:hypothetical protein
MNGYWHGYGPTKPRARHGRGAGPRLPLTIVNLPLQAAPATPKAAAPDTGGIGGDRPESNSNCVWTAAAGRGLAVSNSGLRVGHWPQAVTVTSLAAAQAARRRCRCLRRSHGITGTFRTVTGVTITDSDDARAWEELRGVPRSPTQAHLKRLTA